MFRENIIKNTKNQPPTNTLKLGLLVGKHCASQPIILIKKKKALLYLSPPLSSPHRRSSPSASNLASHPSTPPLPQIHHPTITGLVLMAIALHFHLHHRQLRPQPPARRSLGLPRPHRLRRH